MSDASVQPGVLGLVHDAHATAAEQFDRAVAVGDQVRGAQPFQRG